MRIGGKPVFGEGGPARFFDAAIAERHGPHTAVRAPARCSACDRRCELTLPLGAGTPPCACGNGVLSFDPPVFEGVVNPALAPADRPPGPPEPEEA